MASITKIGKDCVFEVKKIKAPVHDIFFFTIKARKGENLAEVRGFNYGEAFAVDHYTVDKNVSRGMQRWLASRMYSLLERHLKKLGVKTTRLRTHKALGYFLIKHAGYRKVFETPIGIDVEKNIGLGKIPSQRRSIQKPPRRTTKKTPRRLRLRGRG